MQSFGAAGESKSAENTQVAREVTGALVATGRTPLRRVQVLATNGVVTLRGRVSSYYLKQVAQAVALRVDGVCQVYNEVHVG
jgi:osmotically-inducible protein OsmY